MPNNVTNILEIKGDPYRVQALFNAIKDDHYGLGTIDFEKIIPTPEALKIEESTRTQRGLKAYKDFVEVFSYRNNPTEFDLLHIHPKAEQAYLRVHPNIRKDAWILGRKAFQNEKKYGCPTWYKWCIKNWGTKWNAYGYMNGVQFDGKSLRFQTAWSPPEPIIAKLAEMYPDLDFTHQFASEDIGVNCGENEYHNGSLCGEYRPAGVEAVEYANSLWGYDEQDEDEEMEESEDMGGMKI